MPNGMESLRTLLKMPSISNVSGLSQRGLDIASGLGDYEPSEAELLAAQQATGGGISRETLRSGALDHVRKMLTERKAQQGRQDELAARAQQDALAKQELVNKGNEGVARIQGDARVNAAENSAAAAWARLQDQQAAQAALQDDRLAARAQQPGTQATTVPSDMDKRLSETRKSFQGAHPLDYLLDKLPGGSMLSGTQGRQRDYINSLTSVLTRTGKMQNIQAAADYAKANGLSAADAINQFKQGGVTLDPYEQEFLQLTLGR